MLILTCIWQLPYTCLVFGGCWNTPNKPIQGGLCLRKKNEHKYNGWANYETWAVKLWLRSSRSSRSYWTERARELHGSHTAVDLLSDQLKDKLIDASPLQEPSVYADLLNAALSKVDWYELARSYLDQLGEEKASHEKPSAPEREDAQNPFGKVIFAYTRKRAIEDGVLVDVTETGFTEAPRLPLPSGLYICRLGPVRESASRGRASD